MADSTAMTVDFLRARLLSERSVSRAAKERADDLAKRVAELEEQVRAVTAQRRQAERAADEVLAILESQGFGAHLSDDGDSGSDHDGDDAKSRGGTARAPCEEETPAAQADEAEDALSETGAQAQPGGLSWKGRSVSPRTARQLVQRHHRRSCFRLLASSADSPSPKYRRGQSCRKNKRRLELSNGGGSASPEADGGNAVTMESQKKGRRDGSDCTGDGHADMDDSEAGGDERSSGDGGGSQYVIRYERDGEMERVLERQAELIGQYEEEEKAQREWEKQFDHNRNVDKINQVVHSNAKAKSSDKTDPRSSGLPAHGSRSESPQDAPLQNGARRRRADDEPDHRCAQLASISSAQGSSSNSTITGQNQDRGVENSGADSSYNDNARSPQRNAMKAPSDGSPSGDTPDSKVSDWSSSRFQDHTDSQLGTRSGSVDVGSVLEALQRARISLSATLSSRPLPPSQVTLALPAPGDEHKEYDDDDILASDGGGGSSYREAVSGSSPARHEMLALPAPEDYHEREDWPVNDTGNSISGNRSSESDAPREEVLALPAPGDDCRREIEDYMKIPVTTPGLFRLPTDSFPEDQTMFSSNYAHGSGLSLGAAASALATSIVSSSNPAARGAASVSEDGSVFSAKQCCDLRGSTLFSVPTSGRCSSVPRPDFTGGDSPLFSGIPGLGEGLGKGMALADADLFMQRAVEYTVSNKWML